LKPPLVDSHCHLAFQAFDPDREAVIARAREAGLVGCVAVAVDAASAEAARALARRHPGWLVATAGLHPTEEAVADPDELQAVEALLASGDFAAVGETGLDAHHDCAPLEVQEHSLTRHLELSLELDLPVVLHCREAFAPMARALLPFRGRPLRGVLHCFTGCEDDLAPLLEAGLHIGVGGIATYKRNDALRAAVRAVPRERLLLETDAPWLAPQAVRGKRNEPAYVAHTAAFLADDLGLPLEELAATTTANARALFGLDGTAAD
jgi:TatD DNase family protein